MERTYNFSEFRCALWTDETMFVAIPFVLTLVAEDKLSVSAVHIEPGRCKSLEVKEAADVRAGHGGNVLKV